MTKRMPTKADVSFYDGQIKIHVWIKGEEFAFIFSEDELQELRHEKGEEIRTLTF